MPNQTTHGVAIVVDDMMSIINASPAAPVAADGSPAVLDQINPDSCKDLAASCRDITVVLPISRLYCYARNDLRRAGGCAESLSGSRRRGRFGTGRDSGLSSWGDAVMAWFNAPTAAGGHSLRAVRAALALNLPWKHCMPNYHRGASVFCLHYRRSGLRMIGFEHYHSHDPLHTLIDFLAHQEVWLSWQILDAWHYWPASQCWKKLIRAATARWMAVDVGGSRHANASTAAFRASAARIP